MKIFKQIIPVILLSLFVVNIIDLCLMTENPTSLEISDESMLTRADLESNIPQQVPKSKVSNEIIDGNTTLQTDKDSYTPGEWVTITANSTSDEMNGSLEWQLESPINEIAFDFSEYQDIFKDPSFDNPLIPDWTNESFDFVEAASGYLNLTEISDTDENDDEIFYKTEDLTYGEKYEISFDYLSQGENLLVNPGFETGTTAGWYGNTGNVIVKSDSNNASEGIQYASINGTAGLTLYQNITNWKGGRMVTFSAKATGVTSDNNWRLKLEAYNISGHWIGEKSISDSEGFTTDEKGYAFNKILRWLTPENTTTLKAIFNSFSETYLGWLDDCYLAEVPPSLIFSYWDKGATTSEWKNVTLVEGTHEWQNTGIFLNEVPETPPPIDKTFRFILKDDSKATNITTAYWLIDNITVNYIVTTEKTTGTFSNQPQKITGSVNSTWFHQGFRENLSSTFNIEVKNPVDGISDCFATIKVQLPKHQMYFGSWIFVFMIHQIDSAALYIDTKLINISFMVNETMNYVIQDIYMLRGTTNETIGNTSIYSEYFEQETNIQAISPGDNVTLLGFLEANSTKNEWYDLEFLRSGSMGLVSVNYGWNSNWESQEYISWSEFGFIPYNKTAETGNTTGETILQGHFNSPLDNTSTMALNFKIPERGIYGNLSANLSIILTGTNIKENGEGGKPLEFSISLDLPPVKFKINITEENLPASSYYLTEYLDGNITLEFLNFNDTLNALFPNRNISSDLSIPMKDLELTIFLDNLDDSPNEIDISQRIHYHYIGKTVLWLDPINPHLLSGTYAFRIRWNTPYEQGVKNQEELEITHSIEVKGNLVVFSSSKSPVIQQGGQETINFSIHLDNETGKRVGGLNLIGIVDDNLSSGYLTIYEESGVYKINIDVSLESEANKNYTIKIFLVGRENSIGEIDYQVIERESYETETITPEDQLVGIIGFSLFILICVGFIGILYWANKALK